MSPPAGAVRFQPFPVPDAESCLYWDNVRAGRIGVQRCASCGRVQFPFGAVCRRCLGATLDWTPASGDATVQSWIVVRRCIPIELGWEVPYCVVLAELAEGPRLYALFQAGDGAGLRAGMAVRIATREIQGVVLPVAVRAEALDDDLAHRQAQ